MVAAAVAAGIAAAACRSGKSASDSAAVSDTAAAALAADSVALPAPGAPGTAPSPVGSTPVPNGTAKPAAKPSATHPATATTKQEPSVPIDPPRADTNPRPSNQAPAGATTPALVVFRDSVMTSDLDWLRSQGFTIVNVQSEAHAVSVRVPQSYHGNPKANPRVLRFTIAMR